MPFTSLVQRQFSLRALAQSHAGVTAPQTRDITVFSRKRRTGSAEKNGSRATREDIQRTPIPAWVTHLDSFRYHSLCTSSTFNAAIGLTPRSTASLKALHRSVPEFIRVQSRHCKTSAQYVDDINELVKGNKTFRQETLINYPGFFEESSKGQKPPYMLIDCSDSRVAEHAIFDARPGTMFTSGSIANQFHEWDLNSNSVLSYAVETLEVRHVIVMGHYGCGGVAASMLPVSLPLEHPAHIAVQTWIQPIREIYLTSTRPEIVEHRDRCKIPALTEPPNLHDPAFRALVEENVKANVKRIANSYVMRDHYASLPPPPHPSSSIPIPEHASIDPNSLKGTYVFIHGWVYDLENGDVTDLNVTVGPPGREIPKSPWPSCEVMEREKRLAREAKS